MGIKRSWLPLAALTLMVAALAGEGPASAHEYSNKDARGIYNFSTQYSTAWQTSGKTSTKYEYSTTSQLLVDGKGNFSGPETDIIGCALSDCGQLVCSGTTTGTYQINPDGSGTATETIVYTDKVNCGSFTSTFTFDLSDGGNRIVLQQLSPGTTTVGGVTTPLDSTILVAIGIRLER